MIIHYLCNNNAGYSCLLGASNAMNRIHYGKLFNIVLCKEVPFAIVFFLLDAYSSQEARVIWNSCKSQYCLVYNGDRQWGCITPIVFNAYIIY